MTYIRYMYMIIKIIIFKGVVIEITIECPEIRDHIKHKTPHKLNFVLKRKSYERTRGPPLL